MSVYLCEIHGRNFGVHISKDIADSLDSGEYFPIGSYQIIYVGDEDFHGKCLTGKKFREKYFCKDTFSWICEGTDVFNDSGEGSDIVICCSVCLKSYFEQGPFPDSNWKSVILSFC